MSKCIALGLYTAAMLGKFSANPVLGAIAATLTTATNGLASSQKAYADGVIALIPLRVGVKFVDYRSDKAVRALQRQAEVADDKKGGKIGTALFPDGVTPIIRPVGDTQVTEMRALEGRMDAATALWPAVPAEKAKITAERAAYETALNERKTGMQTSADLRAKRDAAKEDFLDVYASTAARVKAEFPRDRAMQDLFFDRVTDVIVADEEDDADEAAPGTPDVPPPVVPT